METDQTQIGNSAEFEKSGIWTLFSNTFGFHQESRICQQTWGHQMAVQFQHLGQLIARRRAVLNGEAGPQCYPSKRVLRVHSSPWIVAKAASYPHAIVLVIVTDLGPKYKNNHRKNEDMTLIGRIFY